MNSGRRNIAIVCQRFGKEINGGAEVHAYMVAKQLSTRYNITVLTSCAVDYLTWNPEFSPGVYHEDGLKIIRFQNETRSDKASLRHIRRKITGRLWYQRLHKYLGKPKWWRAVVGKVDPTEDDQLEWLKRQGPYMPGLVDYLLKNEEHYDAFICITMLYYPSAITSITLPSKTILVPTLHDEKASYFPVYKKVMQSPEWLLFNTIAEEKVAQRLYHITRKTAIAGVGIDIIKGVYQYDPSVPVELGIKNKYIIYVGRIDKNKGCHILIKWFTRYLKETGIQLSLVLVGKSHMKLPVHPAIIYTGFLPGEQKTQLMLQAEALVIPSFYESLSLVLLESMACGVPVIANADAEVLKDHILNSGAGWAYQNYGEFKNSLNALMNDKVESKRKGQLGYAYVKDNYSWEHILHVYENAITDISNKIKTHRAER